ncbi:MAG: exosortase system-associated protein, TIGR04073 family [Lentisphaeria bacterium]
MAGKSKVAITAALTVMCVANLQGAVNEDYDLEYTSSRKLGRGVSNVLFGIVEIPKTMVEQDKEQGALAAYTTGVVAGIGRFLQREVVGVWEILTFWSCDKEPIIKPEHVLFSPYEDRFDLDVDRNNHTDHSLHTTP